jgi:hypothetical protein
MFISARLCANEWMTVVLHTDDSTCSAGLGPVIKNLQYLQTTTESVKSRNKNISSKCKGHGNHTTVHVLKQGTEQM